MMSIHEQEQLIFEEYKKNLGKDRVSEDGLHYLGELDYKKGYWERATFAMCLMPWADK